MTSPGSSAGMPRGLEGDLCMDRILHPENSFLCAPRGIEVGCIDAKFYGTFGHSSLPARRGEALVPEPGRALIWAERVCGAMSTFLPQALPGTSSCFTSLGKSLLCASVTEPCNQHF